MIFRRFPYTTLNDINLDWIIKQVKQIAAALQGKQDKPDAAGTAGQVLGLDENLDPVWLDQSGGGGTNNYNNLTNKPQINSVTLSGNKTAADLGLANASDIPTVPVQSVNGQTGAVVLDAANVGALPSSTFIPGYSLQLPVMDGEASAGTNFSRYAMEGHRHPTDTSRASKSVIGIVQDTDTATENISKGKYVIWHGALYTASDAIVSGATLSSSNLTEVGGGGLNDIQRALKFAVGGGESATNALQFLTFVTDGTSQSVYLPSGFRGLLLSSSAWSGETGIINVIAASNGTPDAGKILGSTDVTINTSTPNAITVQTPHYAKHTLLAMASGTSIQN